MGICAAKKDDGSVKNDKSQKTKEKANTTAKNDQAPADPQANGSQPQKAVQEEKLQVTSPKGEPKQAPPQPEEAKDDEKARPKNRGTINEVTDDYLQGMYEHGVENDAKPESLNKIE